MLQYRAYTAYSLENTGTLFNHYVLNVLYISRSQGGGRTTAMLPSLRPGLLSHPPCPPPLPAHLSPPRCCLDARPFESLARPRSPPPPTPFLRPAAYPSTSSSRLPTPLLHPVLLRRLRRSRCVPPSPARCCTVDNGKEEE